ncbi:uncharacterized protein LOC110736663 [Chenopodium quinoa]|uniref:uncharacterized protein LOC110736663 n=1 Tax=Chenopodium quinoa TaxID=63459 RepID=UPI000B78D03B|nr:uncharacterized protein LOC110736663 [Chenopodium quinoa]
MLLSGNSFLCTHISHHSLRKKGKRFPITFAKKPDFPENEQNPNFKFKISSKLLTQSAIGILGLGFVDAGYSGDWSRIGVISTETEDLLKIAAFLVVPLCLFVILSVAKNPEN